MYMYAMAVLIFYLLPWRCAIFSFSINSIRMHLTLVLLNKLTHPFLFVSQSDYLIQIQCGHKFIYWMTNSADPDQLASEEANWSGSTLFANTAYIRAQQDKGLSSSKDHIIKVFWYLPLAFSTKGQRKWNYLKMFLGNSLKWKKLQHFLTSKSFYHVSLGGMYLFSSQ